MASSTSASWSAVRCSRSACESKKEEPQEAQEAQELQKFLVPFVLLVVPSVWFSQGGLMVRLIMPFVAVLISLSVAGVQSQRQPAGSAHNGKAFRFNKVGDGVYHAVGTGALTVVGNSSVIVNDDDVVVVDDHVSPAAAWVLLQELKDITSKPVRTVVNTHFHFDHAHGNQIFDKDVAIIGHEFTREMLTGGKSIEMPLFKNYLAGIPRQIEDLKKRIAAEPDRGKKSELETQLHVAENNNASQAELKPTPPNVTLQTRMTLHRRFAGTDREIQIRFLERAHTAGDVVVYLPKEKIVCTGDMLTAGLSNMSDAFVKDRKSTRLNSSHVSI